MNDLRPTEHLKRTVTRLTALCVVAAFASSLVGALQIGYYPARYLLELAGSSLFFALVAYLVLTRLQDRALRAVALAGSAVHLLVHALSMSDRDLCVASALFPHDSALGRFIVAPLGDSLLYVGGAVLLYRHVVDRQVPPNASPKQTSASWRSTARVARFKAVLRHPHEPIKNQYALTDEHGGSEPEPLVAAQANLDSRTPQPPRSFDNNVLAEAQSPALRSETELGHRSDSQVLSEVLPCEMIADNPKRDRPMLRQAVPFHLCCDQQLRLLVDALPLGIAYCDPSEAIRFANKPLAGWLRADCLELSGKLLHEAVGNDAYQQLQPYLAKVFEGQTVECQIELPLPVRGAPSRAAVSLLPDFDDQGCLRGFFSLLCPPRVLARSPQDWQTFSAETAHESRLHTMGELVVGITHELSQPLYAIGNFATAAEATLEKYAERVDARLYEWIGQIIKEGNRAQNILRGLRNFVRRDESQRVDFNLDELVQESVQLVAFEARRRGIDVRRELNGPRSPLRADRVQIQQVIVNLLRNAYDATAMQEPGRRVVTLRTTYLDGQARVFVIDNGMGLPATQAEMLFAPFVTTKEDGLGMGLAISRAIIEAHRGTIWARRSPTGGAIFGFTLSCSEEAEFDDE